MNLQVFLIIGNKNILWMSHFHQLLHVYQILLTFIFISGPEQIVVVIAHLEELVQEVVVQEVKRTAIHVMAVILILYLQGNSISGNIIPKL